jgi:hypothetical protein
MWTSGLVRQVFKAVNSISPVRYYEFSYSTGHVMTCIFHVSSNELYGGAFLVLIKNDTDGKYATGGKLPPVSTTPAANESTILK